MNRVMRFSDRANEVRILEEVTKSIFDVVRDHPGIVDLIGDGEYVYVQEGSGGRSFYHLNRREHGDIVQSGFYYAADRATKFSASEVASMIRYGLLVDVWYDEEGEVQLAHSRHSPSWTLKGKTWERLWGHR